MLWGMAVSASAADTNAVLEAWLAGQAKIHSWSADFVQTRHLKTITQPLVSEGKLWFSAPCQFRWELGIPAKTIALRQTNSLFIIYPGRKRAEQYPLDKESTGPAKDALAIFEAGFPRSRKELDQNLHLVSMLESNGVWTVAFEPNSSNCRRFLPIIQVSFRSNDFSLVATELHFSEGSSVHTRFTNAVLNPLLDGGLFSPKLPADFIVNQPLSK